MGTGVIVGIASATIVGGIVEKVLTSLGKVNIATYVSFGVDAGAAITIVSVAAKFISALRTIGWGDIMGSVEVLGISAFLGCALIGNSKGTIALVGTFVGARVTGILCSKVVGSLNKSHAEMVELCSWCVAGMAGVGLINNALKGLGANEMVATYNFFTRIAGYLGKAATWLDKIIPG